MTNNDWLSFYKKVREEYSSSPFMRFLCDSSVTFRDNWNTEGYFTTILEHAKEFLESSTDYDGCSVGFCLLFHCGSRTREIRVDFLNWIINKLTQEQQ